MCVSVCANFLMQLSETADQFSLLQKYIPNPPTSLHFHCYAPGARHHHHLSPTTLQGPPPGLPLVPCLWSILHSTQSNLF